MGMNHAVIVIYGWGMQWSWYSKVSNFFSLDKAYSDCNTLLSHWLYYFLFLFFFFFFCLRKCTSWIMLKIYIILNRQTDSHPSANPLNPHPPDWRTDADWFSSIRQSGGRMADWRFRGRNRPAPTPTNYKDL